MKRLNRIAATSMLAAALVAAAVPAWAHPTFRPAEVEAGAQEIDLGLLVPHGCSDNETVPPPEDEATATIEIALEIPESVHLIEAGTIDGWDVSVEEGDATVVTWLATAGGTTELLTFPMVVDIPAEDDDAVLNWNVFQRCETGQYRWVGSDHADEGTLPAARLTLTGLDVMAAAGDHGEDMPDEHATDDEHAAEVGHGDEMADGEHASEMQMSRLDQSITSETAADGDFMPAVWALLAIVALLLGYGVVQNKKKA